MSESGQEVREWLIRLRTEFDAYCRSQDAMAKTWQTELDRRMQELNDVRLRFLPREVYEQHHQTLVNKVETLEKWRATIVGVALVVTVAVSIVSATVGALIGHLLAVSK